MNTRKMLLNAFYELAHEYDVDDITVQMILDRAQLSRGTFYRHYTDKYDLMNSYYRDYASNLLFANNGGENMLETIELIFQHVEQNQSYYKRIFKTEGIESFRNFLSKYAFNYYALKCMQKRGVDELDSETSYTIEGLSGCHIAIMRKWVIEDCPLPYQQMARICYDMIPAEILQAL